MISKSPNEIACLGVSTDGSRVPITISQLVNIKGEGLDKFEGLQLFKYIY